MKTGCLLVLRVYKIHALFSLRSSRCEADSLKGNGLAWDDDQSRLARIEAGEGLDIQTGFRWQMEELREAGHISHHEL